LNDTKFKDNQSWQSDYTVVDLEKLIINYFDSCFLAAALRYFSNKHIIGQKDDPKVAAAIEKLEYETVCSGIIEELAWAAVNRKLPKVPVIKLFDNIETKNDCQKHLLELLLLVE